MIKFILFLAVILVSIIAIYSFRNKKPISDNLTSIYDSNIHIKDIDGNDIDFNKFKGKKLLLVNVASKCGFTPQYEDLQKLHEKYKDKLTILGLPCNQFKDQEPGTNAEIKEFCTLNYGVTFLVTEKIDVKGENQHPIYQWLTNKSKNGLKDSSVKWNFQKYLLDENGRLIDFYYSITKPLSDSIVKNL
jgi:glutathione peroxidase